jgi:kynureninase
VRRELHDHLNPPVYGWHNVRCPDYLAQEQLVWRSGARKFEPGTHNLLGLVGLKAALELLLEVGIENVAAELLRKRARLVAARVAAVCRRDMEASVVLSFVNCSTHVLPDLSLHSHLERTDCVQGILRAKGSVG